MVGQAADRDSATFVDIAEKRSWITTTSKEPILQGIGGTVGGISKAIFSSFGTADRQFAGFDVVVAQVQADTLGTPQAGTVQNGNEGGVTNSGPSRRQSRRRHQAVLQPQLTRAVLTEEIALPDVPTYHLNRPMPCLVHDGPL